MFTVATATRGLEGESAMTTAALDSAAGTELVFVPADVPSGPDSGAQLQLRHMEDGRLAVLAYTSLELLVAGCGPRQSWIAAPVEELETLQSLAGFDVIAVNVELPQAWRVAAGPNDSGQVVR